MICCYVWAEDVLPGIPAIRVQYHWLWVWRSEVTEELAKFLLVGQSTIRIANLLEKFRAPQPKPMVLSLSLYIM